MVRGMFIVMFVLWWIVKSTGEKEEVSRCQHGCEKAHWKCINCLMSVVSQGKKKIVLNIFDFFLFPGDMFGEMPVGSRRMRGSPNEKSFTVPVQLPKGARKCLRVLC